MNRADRRHPGAIPTIRARGDYICPKCGNRPYVTDSGEPEALKVQRDGGKGRTGLHCADCFVVWQEAQSALMPFQVPELEFRPVDASNPMFSATPKLVRAS